MNKHEWITLGVGAIAVGAFAWIGGFFAPSPLAINTITPMNLNSNVNTPSGIPEVKGSNVSKDPNIQIIEAEVGTGAEAVAGKQVSVHYTGRLEDGTIFDSSYSRGEPIVFALSTGRVIKGWDMGIIGMKVGGKRRLIIAPEYAYGTAGVPGAIPANATLIFDVELAAVK